MNVDTYRRSHAGQCARLLSGALLVVAIVLIVFATLAPTDGRVGSRPPVWCLGCGPTWLADAISNVVLFVPLGFALALVRCGVARAVVIGSVLSLGIELLQSVGLPPGRTAGLADWIANSAGALFGAMIVAHRGRLLSPSRHLARRLVVGWIVSIAAMFGMTSWALSPNDLSIGQSSTVTPSTQTFTVGYGWFSALADSVSVNGVPILHQGTGPVMAVMSRTDTMHFAVRVIGHDTRETLVPIVFVHVPGEYQSLAMMGARGADAVLSSSLKARRIGLEAPDLSLHDVFSVDAGRADAISGVHLRGVVNAARLTLSAEYRDGTSNTMHATLRLTPALAWTTMQSVVGTGSPIAGLVTIAWLLVWFVPLGWWSARACSTRARLSARASSESHVHPSTPVTSISNARPSASATSLSHARPTAPVTSVILLVTLCTAAALATSVVLAPWFEISQLEVWQTLTCVAGAIVGGVAAWYVPSTAELRGSHEQR